MRSHRQHRMQTGDANSPFKKKCLSNTARIYLRYIKSELTRKLDDCRDNVRDRVRRRRKKVAQATLLHPKRNLIIDLPPL